LAGQNDGSLIGYKGVALDLLMKYQLAVGDTIKIITIDEENTGILMPRYESSDETHVVIKLTSGYNIGIGTEKIRSIVRLTDQSQSAGGPSTAGKSKPPIPVDEYRESYEFMRDSRRQGNAKIALIGTGGTIASKVDYRTGGVTAALSALELYDCVPELEDYASIEPEVLLNEFSENIKPAHWTIIANRIAEKVWSGNYQGIIVSHGTDTMHYTAAALSFALQNLPIPVVLVGAQRSPDRPSSDSAQNLLGATIFATKSDLSGVFVSMHATPSDDVIACHLGTRVRKNHTSRRDAFETIDGLPIALIRGGNPQIEVQETGIKLKARGHDVQELVVRPNFDSKATLIKYYPGFDPEFIAHLVEKGYRAIILEGTGLGHVSSDCFRQLREAVESGTMVFLTSQCIWGRTKLTVYETGRDLLDIGVIPLSNMISETALVKAMWTIANTKDIKSAIRTMQENISNEISMRITTL
jgi:glutamyl-tRNA(Gln) amidotransferase subunit D